MTAVSISKKVGKWIMLSFLLKYRDLGHFPTFLLMETAAVYFLQIVNLYKNSFR